MELINQNINRFLPFGDSLRIILQNTSYSPNDIKGFLKRKGVFIDGKDESIMIPLLTTTLVSPIEFDHIKEKIKTKEDKEKLFTRVFECNSTAPLISSLPENFNIQEIIKEAFPRYKVIGNPNFVAQKASKDKNERIALEFKCESENYSKEWYRAKNDFKGEIALEKIVKNNELQLQITYTSQETKDVSEKVFKKLEKHFKKSKIIDENKEAKKITFSSFTNEERVEFLLSFTEGNDVFEFDKACSVDLGPGGNQLPNELSWLNIGGVRRLALNGDILHEIPYLTNLELRPFIELSSVEIQFKFKYHAAEGMCKALISFPDYFKRLKQNTELEIYLHEIKPNNEYAAMPLGSITRYLNGELENLKSQLYSLIEVKQIAKQFAQN
jgi:hypothetical protein